MIYEMIYINFFINVDMWKILKLVLSSILQALVTYKFYEDVIWTWGSLPGCLYNKCYQRKIQYYFPSPKIIETIVSFVVEKTLQE